MNASAKLVTRGFWQIPTAVKNVLCPDGKRRYGTITGEASYTNVFCFLPATVKVYKDGQVYTVSGTIVNTRNGDYEFITCEDGKNAHMLPNTKN